MLTRRRFIFGLITGTCERSSRTSCHGSSTRRARPRARAGCAASTGARCTTAATSASSRKCASKRSRQRPAPLQNRERVAAPLSALRDRGADAEKSPAAATQREAARRRRERLRRRGRKADDARRTRQLMLMADLVMAFDYTDAERALIVETKLGGRSLCECGFSVSAVSLCDLVFRLGFSAWSS